MKRSTLIAGVAALSLIAAAGGAVAFGKKDGHHGMRGGHGGPLQNFEEIDTNADGKVTKDEMEAHFKARFAKADTDGDGKLSAKEMQAAAQARQAERMAKRTARMIERMDTDGDGMLSMAEMPGQDGRADKMFDRVDANGDGAITKDEMAEMRGKHGKRHGKKNDSE